MFFSGSKERHVRSPKIQAPVFIRYRERSQAITAAPPQETGNKQQETI